MIQLPAFSRRSFLQTTTTLAGALALPRVSFGAEVRPAPGMPAPRFVQTNSGRSRRPRSRSSRKRSAMAGRYSPIRSQTSESWTVRPSTSRAGGWSVSVRSPNS